MMTLIELNRRLIPLQRKLVRARASNGVMVYALAPDFSLVWRTYRAALDDLMELRWVHAPPRFHTYRADPRCSGWPDAPHEALGAWLSDGIRVLWIPPGRCILPRSGTPPHLRDAGCEVASPA